MVEPHLRHQDGSRHQRDAGLQSEAFGRTAPWPVLGLAHQAQGDRSPLDEHTVVDQVGRCPDRRDNDRQGYCGPVASRSLGSGYPSGQTVDGSSVGCRDDQMPGVRQQAEREQQDLILRQIGPKALKLDAVVGGPVKSGSRAGQPACETEVASGAVDVGHHGVSWEAQKASWMPHDPDAPGGWVK